MNCVHGSVHLSACLSHSFRQHLFLLEGTLEEEEGRLVRDMHHQRFLLKRRMADFVTH